MAPPNKNLLRAPRSSVTPLDKHSRFHLENLQKLSEPVNRSLFEVSLVFFSCKNFEEQSFRKVFESSLKTMSEICKQQGR